MHERLYEELRQTEQEILYSLKKQDNQIEAILVEELRDIRTAMDKMEKGIFGFCEISGESIPDEVLLRIPTIKTLNEVSRMQSFYRKPLHLDS